MIETLRRRPLTTALVASVALHAFAAGVVDLPYGDIPPVPESLSVELRDAPKPPRRLPPRAKAPAPKTAAAPTRAEAPAPPAPEPTEAPAGGPAEPAPTPVAEEPAAEPPATAEAEAPALMDVRGLARSADMLFHVYRGDGKVGDLHWEWRLDGRDYHIETRGTATGLAAMFLGGVYRQTSEGRVGANGLEPRRYTFERGSAERLDSIDFDWGTGKAAGAYKGKSVTVELVPGAQDLMSFLHQLPLLPAESLSIPLVTPKKLRDYAFAAPKPVRVKVPAGEMDALYYQRIGTDTEAEVWLQDKPPYLPIRVRLFDRLGNRFEQVLAQMRYE